MAQSGQWRKRRAQKHCGTVWKRVRLPAGPAVISTAVHGPAAGLSRPSAQSYAVTGPGSVILPAQTSCPIAHLRWPGRYLALLQRCPLPLRNALTSNYLLRMLALMPSPRAGLHRQFLFGGLRIGLYEPVKKLFMGERPPGDAPLYLKIAAGLTTGALAIMVANPTDLVKARRPSPPHMLLGSLPRPHGRSGLHLLAGLCPARCQHCSHADFRATASCLCRIECCIFPGNQAVTHLPVCAGAHAGGQHGGTGAGGRGVDGRLRAGRAQGGRRGEALPQRARCLRHHRAARARTPLVHKMIVGISGRLQAVRITQAPPSGVDAEQGPSCKDSNPVMCRPAVVLRIVSH